MSLYWVSLLGLYLLFVLQKLTVVGTLGWFSTHVQTTHTNTHRLGLIPALMRIHQESCTFRESAIRDLAISIQLLEKARSEYRAALLWMKNVSMKLQNPDYRDQLAKFREVCVCRRW